VKQEFESHFAVADFIKEFGVTGSKFGLSNCCPKIEKGATIVAKQITKNALLIFIGGILIDLFIRNPVMDFF
jgi:hypothetical protein